MVSDYNKVILCGHLVADPEHRYTVTGSTIANFTVAANPGGSKHDEVAYVPVTAFARQADLASEHLRMGNMVLVEGRLRTDQWTARDGSRRSRLVMVCESFSFMSPTSAPCHAAIEEDLDLAF